MKSFGLIFALLVFRIAFPQDCIPSKEYYIYHDAIEINCVDFSENELLKSSASEDYLQLTVFPNENLKFPREIKFGGKRVDYGFKIILSNYSNTDLNLWNMDGQIIVARQIFHNDEWVSISSKYKTYGICGNSFFSERTIKSKSALTFVAPRIVDGEKVKMRFMILIKSEEFEDSESVVISNEFDAFFDKAVLN